MTLTMSTQHSGHLQSNHQHTLPCNHNTRVLALNSNSSSYLYCTPPLLGNWWCITKQSLVRFPVSICKTGTVFSWRLKCWWNHSNFSSVDSPFHACSMATQETLSPICQESQNKGINTPSHISIEEKDRKKTLTTVCLLLVWASAVSFLQCSATVDCWHPVHKNLSLLSPKVLLQYRSTKITNRELDRPDSPCKQLLKQRIVLRGHSK